MAAGTADEVGARHAHISRAGREHLGSGLTWAERPAEPVERSPRRTSSAATTQASSALAASTAPPALAP